MPMEPLTKRKHLMHFGIKRRRRRRKKTQDCCAVTILFQTIVGQHFSPKSPKIDFSSQTFLFFYIIFLKTLKTADYCKHGTFYQLFLRCFAALNFKMS